MTNDHEADSAPARLTRVRARGLLWVALVTVPFILVGAGVPLVGLGVAAVGAGVLAVFG